MKLGALRLGKFGPREKALTLVFVVVTVWAVGYRNILRPRTVTVRKAKAAYVKLDNELVRLQAERPDVDARRKQFEKVQAQVTDFYHELEHMEEGLLNRQDLDVLLDQVVAERKRLQVQINAVTPLKDEASKGEGRRGREEPAFYRRLFIQVDAYAPFDDLIAYIKALEGRGPYQHVQGVAVKVEGQETVRPRALIMLETLLADTPEQKEKRHTEVFAALEQIAARQAKDPFLAKEKPKEEQAAVGLELTGVFGEGSSRAALINGETYTVGGVIQGKRIVEIQPDHVVLEQGSKRFLLYTQRVGE